MQTSLKSQVLSHPLFGLLFRSHFLLASIASIAGLTVWLAWLDGYLLVGNEGLSPLTWHTHEMLFGFAATVAIGFVLTAVQTWTGSPSITGKPCAILVLLWCCSRASIWINTDVSIVLAMIFQTFWWIGVIATFSHLVLSTKNRRNYGFIPILSLMGVFNIAILWLDITGEMQMSMHLAKTMVLLFTLLMTLVGGRIIPLFTANGTGSPPIAKWAHLDLAIITSTVFSIIFFCSSELMHSSQTLLGPLFCLTGILHIIRLARWRFFSTIRVPLLWSLHLSYGFMALGIFWMGLSYLVADVRFSDGLHLVTVGAIGLMIIAVMSRVALGHTGRPLKPNPLIAFAFSLMVIAAIARAVLPSFGEFMLSWHLSAALWVLAFLLFIYVYWPILSSPRHNI